MKSFNEIQTTLSAPKNQKNSFGNYNYRSLEDILQALKPLLKKTGSVIYFTDDILLIGTRYYVRSKCTLITKDNNIFEAYGIAREQEIKKGMDEAQITGSASSYARKYAICSLLAIDDNKEPDMCDNRDEGEKPAKKKLVTMDHFNKGRCAALVEELSNEDASNPATFTRAAALVADKYKVTFADGVVEAIRQAVATIQQSVAVRS